MKAEFALLGAKSVKVTLEGDPEGVVAFLNYLLRIGTKWTEAED